MTLIVGILCSDGVVLAADGAATLGNLGQQTVRQSCRKLNIIDTKVVVGCSGAVGLAQCILGDVETCWKDPRTRNKPPVEWMKQVRKQILPAIEAELKAAAISATVVGHPVAMASAITQTLVAVPLGEEACLFQFNQQGSPEQASSDLPFISIGSGQALADTFLAFLRRVFWPDNLPSLGEGLLAACWALTHAIETMPGGVAEPMQIAVLEKGDGGKWKARVLDGHELDEHKQFVSEAEKHLRGYSFLSNAEVSSIPLPPSPVD